MQSLQAHLRRVAPSSASVLIHGETGTGKELVARALHEYSPRTGRFVALDCGALPADLAESELFGYRRGAFTTATGDKEGLVEAASRGTLFLDEISNMSLHLQGKLLRVLQEKTIRRLGATGEKTVDVRIIAATNTDLTEHIRSGGFRDDLYYRFPITITVPPLRDRGKDITLLAQYFLTQHQEPGIPKRLSPQALRSLEAYDWPGNVRELHNVVTNAYYHTSTDTIEPEHLFLQHHPAPRPPPVLPRNFWELAHSYRERRVTRHDLQGILHDGLKSTNGNYRKLVGRLGLPDADYRRFMDFLRRNHLTIDYRQYRGRQS